VGGDAAVQAADVPATQCLEEAFEPCRVRLEKFYLDGFIFFSRVLNHFHRLARLDDFRGIAVDGVGFLFRSSDPRSGRT